MKIETRFPIENAKTMHFDIETFSVREELVDAQ